jgi:enoyl-CoA hydratase/carnithine racemase
MRVYETGEGQKGITGSAWGLVNAVVPEEDLPQSVFDLASNIKEKSAQVIALGKKTFYQQINTDLPNAYGLAADAMVCNMFLDDNQEGIDAFLNKRPPVWKNH